jgi:hypothetical protein
MFLVGTDRRTDGVVVHTGSVQVSRRIASGELVTVTLPDDWDALVARVEALEAAVPASVPNSLEDLTYGG